MNNTLLAIGAHYDDCPFGIPGILLGAVRKHYRVVILNIIGDYTAWPPVRGRAEQLRATSIRLALQQGMEMRFLDYASMGFEANEATCRAVAEVVAEVQPDVAFMPVSYTHLDVYKRQQHGQVKGREFSGEMGCGLPWQFLLR